MQFNRAKQVDFSRELPADIQSAYLRHTVQVQFEQYYVRASDRTEPSQEDLTTWCNVHCADIFSVTKWAQNHVLFRFYLADDLQRFEHHLAHTVAHAIDSAT